MKLQRNLGCGDRRIHNNAAVISGMQDNAVIFASIRQRKNSWPVLESISDSLIINQFSMDKKY
jgi:hypothetical protein